MSEEITDTEFSSADIYNGDDYMGSLEGIVIQPNGNYAIATISRMSSYAKDAMAAMVELDGPESLHNLRFMARAREGGYRYVTFKGIILWHVKDKFRAESVTGQPLEFSFTSLERN